MSLTGRRQTPLILLSLSPAARQKQPYFDGVLSQVFPKFLAAIRVELSAQKPVPEHSVFRDPSAGLSYGEFTTGASSALSIGFERTPALLESNKGIGEQSLPFQITGREGSREITEAVDRLPDWCPICRYSVEPKRTSVMIKRGEYSDPKLEIVFQCPREKCAHLFIGRYGRPYHGESMFWLSDCVPVSLP